MVVAGPAAVLLGLQGSACASSPAHIIEFGATVGTLLLHGTYDLRVLPNPDRSPGGVAGGRASQDGVIS